MRRAEVRDILGALQTAYPNQVEVDNATIELWATALEWEDDAVVMRAVGRWVSGNDWWPTVHQIRELIAEERAARPALPRPGGCDGTGWMRRDDGVLWPCARCNPTLRQIHDDPALLYRWLAGTRTRFLVDDSAPVDVPACLQDTRYGPDVPISAREGRQIAFVAYENECREAGRESKAATIELIRRMNPTNPPVGEAN